jgi:FtsZ-binding cell division protein ZapB
MSIEEQISKVIDPIILLKAYQIAINGSLKNNDSDSLNNIKPTTSKSINSYSKDLIKRKIDDSFSNPTHALIFWVAEGKYSTTFYKSIDLGDDMVAEINKVYNIQFNSKQYKGKVILAGSKTDCEKHYENMRLDILEDDTVSEPVVTKPVAKKISNKDSNEAHSFKNQIVELKDENEVLKNKLRDADNLNKDLNKDNLDLKRQLNEQKEKFDALSNSFSKYYLFLTFKNN